MTVSSEKPPSPPESWNSNGSWVKRRLPDSGDVRNYAIAITALILSGALVFLSIEVRIQRRSQECRYDLSADVNRIADRIGVSLAIIVSASIIEGRDAAVIPIEAERIRRDTARLVEASATRDDAVAICN